MNLPLRSLVEAWMSDLDRSTAQRAIVELRALSLVIRQDAQARGVLFSPTLGSKDKQEVLKQAKLGEPMRQLVGYLDRGRLWFKFPAVAQLAERLAEERFAVKPARVLSAVALSEPQRSALKQKLARKFGEVELREQVDPSILGGLIVEVAGLRHDLSVRGRLNRLKRAVLSLT